MTLKDFVLANIVPEKYYQKRFTNWNPVNKGNVRCPWHDDKKPSLSICLNNGGAKCHACGKAIGNVVHFEAQAVGVSEEESALGLYIEFIRPVITIKEIATLQKALTSNNAVKQILRDECGLDESSIRKFHLGWEAGSKRIVIPIFDRWENCVNFRLYKMPKHRSRNDEAYKVLNKEGYGGCDLFPLSLFQDYSLDRPIFIMPSEKEAMLGIQEGLQCVCATAGEQSWKDEWTELFTGYEVCVVAQRDKVGRETSQKKVAILQKVTKRCAVIEPPTQLKDFADFVVMEGGTGLELLAKFKEESKPEVDSTFFEEHSAPRVPKIFSKDTMPLASIGSKPDMLNQVVHTTGIVAAKATITYTIPWKFKVKIAKQNQRFFTLELGRVLLGFVKASDRTITSAVCELLSVEEATVEPVEFINVTEVEIIPTAAVDQDVVYVTQRCLFVGERIDANVPYALEIIPTNDVKTQETIGIVIKATPISRAIELRTFSAEDIATLQIFQPAEDETVMEKMHSLADELAQHYTKIYNRPDWHLVALLTWLSPIGYAFPFEKEMQRGWLNSLAVGDTQTGKSKVIQTLRRIFNAGTIINAENCTYVGLVGGAIKMGSGQFMLRWGRIPLCDKQLVVIEELSGLSIEEISNMSDVRSSGIARLDKGGLSAETNARTRLLALSNVRPINKTLAGYLNGVQAVRELIGHGEDIARFDLIVTLVDKEVSVDVINRPFSSKGLKEAIPEEAFEKLCQFVWSLKPEQIKITTEAYYSVLEETKRLSEIYHASIPIFKGGSGRYKIARIAAAIACLQFKWNGKVILVTEEHIEAASLFLQTLYDKPSFGYLEWSKQMQDRDNVKNLENVDKVFDDRIPNLNKRNASIETLIHMSKFTRDELCGIASLQITAADDLIGVMVRERVLRKGEANVWEITSAGKEYLLEKLKEKSI